MPPLLGVTPIFAISFWVRCPLPLIPTPIHISQAYDASKKLILAVTPNRESNALSIPELATAGFLSAVPTTLVTAPVERAKVLLQVESISTTSVQKKLNVLPGARTGCEWDSIQGCDRCHGSSLSGGRNP